MRALVAALVIGVAAMSLTTGQADARQNDNGVRCTYTDAAGTINFYMPGDFWGSGNVRYVCTQNGTWKQDSGPDMWPGKGRRR